MATKTDKATAMVRFTAEVTIEERYDPDEIIQAAVAHLRAGCDWDWCSDLSGAAECIIRERMDLDGDGEISIDWPSSFTKMLRAAEAAMGEAPELDEQLSLLDPESPTIHFEVADILRSHFGPGSTIDMDPAVQKHVNDLKYNTQRKAS